MQDCRRLEERIDILENVIHFISQELRRLPQRGSRQGDRVQALLDDLYEVLDRHGYRGIVKLVGDVDPENRDPLARGWARDSKGDFYFFKK